MDSTRRHRFVGLNVQGTPAMSVAEVAEDVALVRSVADVAVMQEFKWAWYWRTLRRVLGRGKWRDRWGTAPRFAYGLANPVFGAQPVMWKWSMWRRGRKITWLLHRESQLTARRYLRAVKLKDRQTYQKCWFMTTHFVPGGDRRDSDPARRRLLNHDLTRFGQFLHRLQASGDPLVGQLDANIHPGTPAYDRLLNILTKHGARLYGEHGVEYLFVIDGIETEVSVEKNWRVHGNTDHEGRGITFRLVNRG